MDEVTRITVQPPSIVYQSKRNEHDSLDSTTRMVVDVRLSAKARAALDGEFLRRIEVARALLKPGEGKKVSREPILRDLLEESVRVDVLQYDFNLVMFYSGQDSGDGEEADGEADDAAGPNAMGIVPPPSVDVAASKAEKGVIQLSILPRTLPISSTHSNKPFRLVVHIRVHGPRHALAHTHRSSSSDGLSREAEDAGAHMSISPVGVQGAPLDAYNGAGGGGGGGSDTKSTVVVVEEVVVTTPFHVLAKEPSRAAQGPRPRGQTIKKRKKALMEMAEGSVQGPGGIVLSARERELVQMAHQAAQYALMVEGGGQAAGLEAGAGAPPTGPFAPAYLMYGDLNRHVASTLAFAGLLPDLFPPSLLHRPQGASARVFPWLQLTATASTSQAIRAGGEGKVKSAETVSAGLGVSSSADSPADTPLLAAATGKHGAGSKRSANAISAAADAASSASAAAIMSAMSTRNKDSEGGTQEGSNARKSRRTEAAAGASTAVTARSKGAAGKAKAQHYAQEPPFDLGVSGVGEEDAEGHAMASGVGQVGHAGSGAGGAGQGAQYPVHQHLPVLAKSQTSDSAGSFGGSSGPMGPPGFHPFSSGPGPTHHAPHLLPMHTGNAAAAHMQHTGALEQGLGRATPETMLHRSASPPDGMHLTMGSPFPLQSEGGAGSVLQMGRDSAIGHLHTRPQGAGSAGGDGMTHMPWDPTGRASTASQGSMLGGVSHILRADSVPLGAAHSVRLTPNGMPYTLAGSVNGNGPTQVVYMPYDTSGLGLTIGMGNIGAMQAGGGGGVYSVHPGHGVGTGMVRGYLAGMGGTPVLLPSQQGGGDMQQYTDRVAAQGMEAVVAGIEQEVEGEGYVSGTQFRGKGAQRQGDIADRARGQGSRPVHIQQAQQYREAGPGPPIGSRMALVPVPSDLSMEQSGARWRGMKVEPMRLQQGQEQKAQFVGSASLSNRPAVAGVAAESAETSGVLPVAIAHSPMHHAGVSMWRSGAQRGNAQAGLEMMRTRKDASEDYTEQSGRVQSVRDDEYGVDTRADQQSGVHGQLSMRKKGVVQSDNAGNDVSAPLQGLLEALDKERGQ